MKPNEVKDYIERFKKVITEIHPEEAKFLLSYPSEHDFGLVMTVRHVILTLAKKSHFYNLLTQNFIYEYGHFVEVVEYLEKHKETLKEAYGRESKEI